MWAGSPSHMEEHKSQLAQDWGRSKTDWSRRKAWGAGPVGRPTKGVGWISPADIGQIKTNSGLVVPAPGPQIWSSDFTSTDPTSPVGMAVARHMVWEINSIYPGVASPNPALETGQAGRPPYSRTGQDLAVN